MTKRKTLDVDKAQSARFIEAAKKTGTDASGKTFEKAMKKIVRHKKGGTVKERTP
jgi:hypothetical protein